MPNRGDPGFTLAGFLILAALGAFAWRSAPLESARPITPETSREEPGSDGRMPARLWQDPFHVLQQYPRAILERPDRPATKPPLPRDIAESVQADERSAHELTILMVPVTSRSYAEIQERRGRRRYAILSALGDSGLVPRDPEHLGLYLFEPPSLRAADASVSAVTEGLLATPAADPEQRPLVIPYEWYGFENPNDGRNFEPISGGMQRHRAVVVLWIDESWLDQQPFARTDTLINALLADVAVEGRHRIRWIMLGPARSGTLRQLVKDRYSCALTRIKERSGLGAFHIVSPVATVSDADLLQQVAATDPATGGLPTRGADLEQGAAIESLLGAEFDQPCASGADKAPVTTCMRFLRTIRSDDVLIEQLVRELDRRRIDDQDHVVVLSEWDTYFGRFLPRALAQELLAQGSARRVLRFTYERGIDGIAPGIDPVEPQAADHRFAPPDPFVDSPVPVRRPIGTGQFDYLRRLANVIQAKDRELRHQSGHGIGAVAVLGSDVYDKLLILRALRQQLPGAVWLTTDLDSHLLHPAEYLWTRNLIVASSFDLQLAEDIQPSTPPFRDSYQTAVYLATRMAVDAAFVARKWPAQTDFPVEPFPTQAALYAAMPPRLFEVGRTGAVALALDPPDDREDGMIDPGVAINAGVPSGSGPAMMLAGILFMVLGLLAVHQLRPRSGRVVVVLFALGAAILAVLSFATWQAPGGEPLALRAGVSVWPTEIIRVTTLVLTLVMIRSSLRRLDYNWRWLNHRYFGGDEPIADRGLTLREAYDRLLRFSLRWRAWAVGLGLLLLLLMGLMRLLRAASFDTATLLLLQAGVWGGLIVLWGLFLNGRIVSSVQVRSINIWSCTTAESTALALWGRYREYGETAHRMLRSAAYTLLYFAFGSLVFALFGRAAAPCRGASCAVDGILLGLSVVLMLFLLFLVVDAIRLCICWIEKLQDKGLSWNGTLLSGVARRQRLPESHAVFWVQIHLIGHRTREVGRLLYYPMLTILLLLLARSTYFDNWGFPQALAIIVGVNFAIALVAATRLNSAAMKARDDILERLRDEQLELQVDTSTTAPAATPSEVKELIDQLSKLQLGAYQKIWDQPLVRATLLLLGGLGLTYSEYLPLLS